MMSHKYMIGTTIHACIDRYSCGTGDWITGQIINLCFLNGNLVYDILDRSGNIVHNIEESTITDVYESKI